MKEMILYEEDINILQLRKELIGRAAEAFERILDEMISTWNNLVEFFRDIDVIEVPKVKWSYPSVISMKSQVLNRKPIVIRARCNC
ncbi:hypothetical protein [Bacillus sp. FJAT-49736]|uniref:hypothetical protein n=1 Tax=Bacillus sp. FJAT-49736 TaxID=2833582 RepID=UPI001BC954C8|nr:hypothetical protein [Bacillus sp. FJAT-49736]MBS4171931.1 hypothetical protein [Bacillus sp. FJAT-49736]